MTVIADASNFGGHRRHPHCSQFDIGQVVDFAAAGADTTFDDLFDQHITSIVYIYVHHHLPYRNVDF